VRRRRGTPVRGRKRLLLCLSTRLIVSLSELVLPSGSETLEAAMLIGYARVSTGDQNLDMQRDELKRVGCKRICTDVASGAQSERPGLTEALGYAREGDTLVAWKLDRVGRSLGHLIETVRLLQERRIGFRSLHEDIDTTTSTGKLIFHVFGALAEFERDLVRERTNAGLAAARARGRKGGRRPVLDETQRAVLQSLAQDRTNSPATICTTLRPSAFQGRHSTGMFLGGRRAAPAQRLRRPSPFSLGPKRTPASAVRFVAAGSPGPGVA
jgi:DNA invertase Pin-like site-specific DNA recombinase